MNDAPQTDPLLLETLRTQEFLKVEFQRLTRLLAAQAEELKALRQSHETLSRALAQMEQGTRPPAGIVMPYGLRNRDPEQDEQQHLAAVHRSIQSAFYPPPSPLFLSPAFIRYRQLMSLDLRGKSIGVLTTSCCEYPDLIEATNASQTLEVRLHAINGPFTHFHRTSLGDSGSQTLPGDIESAVLQLTGCDLVWVPDPHLSSLLLHCQGALERIGERVRERLLFSISTEDWQEDEARLRIHRAGFTEIARLLESSAQAYVTRYHEIHGFYVHTAPPEPSEVAGGTLLLIASKIPCASFRITPAPQESPSCL